MATVFIPVAMRPLVNHQSSIRVDAPTVRLLRVALNETYPGVHERMLPNGELAPGRAVVINGSVSPSGLATRLHEQDEVHFLPAIGGG